MTESGSITSGPATGGKSPLWRRAMLLGGLVAIMCVVAAAGWWLAGRRVWTDGRDLRVPAADANLREVLWKQAKPLGPEFNTAAQEYEPSISPDGSEVYFVRGKSGANADIFVSYRRNNAWTEPKPLTDVNTPGDDLGPRLTPDGRFLLFYSDRPGGLGGYDIWAAERTESGFSTPFNLGPNVNSQFNEFSPAPTPDGQRLFFATNRKTGLAQQAEQWKATLRQTGMGDYDLFVADLDPAALAAVAATQPTTPPTSVVATTRPMTKPADDALGLDLIVGATAAHPTTAPSAKASYTLAYKPATEVPGVNTAYQEGASCLSPAGDFLYFASNRPGGIGRFDLYRLRIHSDGTYGEPENLGREVNTPDNEVDPQLAAGGFQIYFSSDRAGSAGGYDLLTAESREVFTARTQRPTPHLGWSVWLLLGALLLLLPLLFMLRGWNDKRLSLFQKCLLVSVLFHVLMTILCSAVVVSREVISYVQKQQKSELTVTLSDAGAGGGAAADVTQQVRQQLTETKVDVPEPSALPQSPTEMALPKATDVAQLNVPLARPDPSAMQVQVQAPHIAPATPAPTAAPQVEVKAPSMQAVAPKLELQPAARVAQAEKPMEIKPVEAPTARAVQTPAVQVAPQAVQVSVKPVDVQIGEAGSMARAVETSAPAIAKPDLGDVGPEVGAAMATGAPAAIEGPKVETSKVSTAGPAAPSASEAKVGVARQETAGAVGEAATVATSIPQAVRSSESLASAAPSANHATDVGAIATSVKPMVERGPNTVVVRGPTTQPIKKVTGDAGPVMAGVEAALPQARSAQAVSETEMAKAVGLPQTGAAPVKVTDVATPSIVSGAVRQPTTRPTAGLDVALDGTLPAASSKPVAAAPLAIAAAIGANATKVAAAGPAMAGASEGTVAAQRQTTGDATGTAQNVETSAPAAAAKPGLAAQSLASAAPADGVKTVAVKTDLPAPSKAAVTTASGAPMELNASPAARTIAKVVGAGAPEATANAPTTVASKAMVDPNLSGPDAIQVAAAPASATGKKGAPAGSNDSLASGAAAAPRTLDLKQSAAPAQPGRPIDGAPFALPAAAMAKPLATGSPLGTPDASIEAPAAVAARNDVKTEVTGPSRIEVTAAPSMASAVAVPLPALAALSVGPRMASENSSALNFKVDVAAPKLSSPPAMFQRSAEQRKPLLEKMGGTKESEDAADRALAYLARNQEAEGHWTRVAGDRGKRRAGKGDSSNHDPALTGLSVLAYLAGDHTPTDPGPYKDVVAHGLDYLLTIQKPDGDLRGHGAGGGADSGNMYDHGIATFAMAEAALMTGDKTYTEAAIRGCEFIVHAQHRKTGGWRYIPGESGDTSVFGWQIMALHSAEQLGYQIPDECRAGMNKYIQIASTGKRDILGGYQPGSGASPPMTAELLFCRIMLDHQISPEQEQEVSQYLTKKLPEKRDADFYGWYYGSLSLIQLQNDAWKTWNEHIRETLIDMQTKGGDNDGMFDGNITWRGQGGRIYTTALACLTLEVYYRYLPLRAEALK